MTNCIVLSSLTNRRPMILSTLLYCQDLTKISLVQNTGKSLTFEKDKKLSLGLDIFCSVSLEPSSFSHQVWDGYVWVVIQYAKIMELIQYCENYFSCLYLKPVLKISSNKQTWFEWDCNDISHTCVQWMIERIFFLLSV